MRNAEWGNRRSSAVFFNFFRQIAYRGLGTACGLWQDRAGMETKVKCGSPNVEAGAARGQYGEPKLINAEKPMESSGIHPNAESGLRNADWERRNRPSAG